MSASGRIVVISGANRGIGFELARQLAADGAVVVLGARDAERGERAASELARAGLNVVSVQLDVTDDDVLRQLAAELEARFGRVDALVNNAAIHYDTWQRASTADMRVVEEALAANLVGAWRTTLHLLPLLRRSDHGRIVNVSSSAGALSDMTGFTPAYSVSKAALNALTLMLADELRADRILVNAVCPGWVATDMGGPGGRPVGEGAAGIRWAVELPDDGPTGEFFRDTQRIAW